MIKIIKRFCALFSAVSLALSCVGCASVGKSSDAKTDSGLMDEDTTSNATAYHTKTTVGISMPARNLERWNRDGAFLKEQFENNGYKVELTYADNSYEKQKKDIARMIDDKVNLLLVAAVDANALGGVLEKAKDNGIPVISYDRLIMNSDAITYYVSFDNYMVGVLQGQFVIDALSLDKTTVSYNVEFVGGDAADNNASFYFNGAYDVLKQYINLGRIRVPSGQMIYAEVTTDGWSTDNAEDRITNILKSFYGDRQELDAVVCANDSTALGVSRAIDKEYQGRNTVIVTGQDGDEENMKNIVDGKQSMTVFKAVANEAVVAFALSDKILKGEDPDESLIGDSNWDFECSYDTESYDNGTGVIPSYLLEPVVVTKDNMKEVLVDSGYYTQDKDGYVHPKG